ncbi:MAG: hypothetical protein KKD74_02240 [Bacteroidetes bacterium]|nr:hypothetical protein [Bacteroidota bacterium]
MKTIILCIFSFFIIPTSIWAQENYGISVSFGLSDINHFKTIFSDHPINGDQYINQNNYHPLVAWSFGAFYIKPIGKKGLGIQAELLLNALGANYFLDLGSPDPQGISVYEHNERLIYLALPLGLRYTQSNWHISGSISNSLLLIPPGKEINYSQAGTYDLGGILAVGIQLFPRLEIELNAYHGFKHMNPDGIEGLTDYRLYNSSIQMALKYTLGKHSVPE